jgi:hypothetical protein
MAAPEGSSGASIANPHHAIRSHAAMASRAAASDALLSRFGIIVFI